MNIFLIRRLIAAGVVIASIGSLSRASQIVLPPGAATSANYHVGVLASTDSGTPLTDGLDTQHVDLAYAHVSETLSNGQQEDATSNITTGAEFHIKASSSCPVSTTLIYSAEARAQATFHDVFAFEPNAYSKAVFKFHVGGNLHSSTSGPQPNMAFAASVGPGTQGSLYTAGMSLDLQNTPSGIVSQEIDLVDPDPADLSSGAMNLFVSATIDAASGAAPGSENSTEADFFNTITVTGLSLYDMNGNLVPDPTVVSALGINYPGTVPEPTGLACFSAVIALFARRRPRH